MAADDPMPTTFRKLPMARVSLGESLTQPGKFELWLLVRAAADEPPPGSACALSEPLDYDEAVARLGEILTEVAAKSRLKRPGRLH